MSNSTGEFAQRVSEKLVKAVNRGPLLIVSGLSVIVKRLERAAYGNFRHHSRSWQRVFDSEATSGFKKFLDLFR